MRQWLSAFNGAEVGALDLLDLGAQREVSSLRE
jgi:hypothetical protein